MRIKFEFGKCIYCLKNPADSWEHIIPTSIGGRLQVQVLCSECNNNLGSKLISKVKTDPSIRLAVMNLRSKIPELFESIENHQIYGAKDENKNLIKLKYKNSKLEIIAHKKENGSLVIDTEKGIKNIVRILEKDRLSKDEIAEKIHTFKKLEDNKIIQLTDKLRVVKWSIEQIFPSLKEPLLDKKVITLIAYEFLSLLIGNLIYNNDFNFIRKFIKEEEQSNKLFIECLTSRHYSPYHKIYLELLENEIIINIILFRWLVYKVHLIGFKLTNTDFVYLEDLTNKKTLIAKSVDEAKQGIYYEF